MSPLMSPNADQTVNDAIAAIRSGDKDRGRILLTRALRLNPQHEQAWLWMSAVVETPEQQRECLNRVLAINPHNDTARQGLKMFERTQAPSAPVPHLGQTSPAAMHDHTRLTDGMAKPMDADAARATLHRVSTSVSRETSRPSTHECNPMAQRCPQCGAVLSYNDSSCAFCRSRVAHAAEPALASLHASSSSYPKRRALTSKDQRRLAGESEKRTGAAHIFNPTTIGGMLVLALGIAPIIFAFSEMASTDLDRLNALPVHMAVVLALIAFSFSLPIAFAGIGVKLIVEGIQQYRYAQLLRTASAVTNAPILDVWQERGYEGEPYIVAWELTFSDGKGRPVQHRGAQRISKNLFHQLQRRDTVQVRFVPDQPAISTLDLQWVAAIEQHSA